METFQFGQCALNVLARGVQLLRVHQRAGAGKLPVRTPGDGHHHLQIPHQFQWRRRSRRRGACLFLRFQKQMRFFENPPADTRRGIAPGGVKLSGLTARASMLGQSLGHALAVAHVGARHRHENLHRHMSCNLPAADLLLHRFGQLPGQSQPARDPAHAAIEAPCQILQAVAKALLQFHKQPTLLQRGFLRRQAHRPVQHQRIAFGHVPDNRLYGVAAQLLQCRDALVAIDDLIPVRLIFNGDNHDRRLLSRCRQRGQQSPLPLAIA